MSHRRLPQPLFTAFNQSDGRALTPPSVDSYGAEGDPLRVKAVKLQQMMHSDKKYPSRTNSKHWQEGGQGYDHRQPPLDGNSYPPSLSRQTMAQADQGPTSPTSVLKQPWWNIESKYWIGGILSESNGNVLKVCTDLKTGQQFVCKSVSKERLTRRPREAERLKQEVAALEAAAGQDFVMALFDTAEDAKEVHLVLESCEGGDLQQRVEKKAGSRGGGGMPEQLAAQVFRNVLLALRRLHSLSICHRDIRPENVKLLSECSDTEIRLTGLDQSAFIKPGQKLSKLITPAQYAAPEMLNQQYSMEADVWSAGCLLHFLLSGRSPFISDSRDGVAALVKEGKVNLKSGAWRTVSIEAKDLVLRMLCVDPSKRISISHALRHPWMEGDGPEQEVLMPSASAGLYGPTSPYGGQGPVRRSSSEAMKGHRGGPSPTMADYSNVGHYAPSAGSHGHHRSNGQSYNNQMTGSAGHHGQPAYGGYGHRGQARSSISPPSSSEGSSGVSSPTSPAAPMQREWLRPSSSDADSSPPSDEDQQVVDMAIAAGGKDYVKFRRACAKAGNPVPVAPPAAVVRPSGRSGGKQVAGNGVVSDRGRGGGDGAYGPGIPSSGYDGTSRKAVVDYRSGSGSSSRKQIAGQAWSNDGHDSGNMQDHACARTATNVLARQGAHTRTHSRGYGSADDVGERLRERENGPRSYSNMNLYSGYQSSGGEQQGSYGSLPDRRGGMREAVHGHGSFSSSRFRGQEEGGWEEGENMGDLYD